jgi:sialic acid synthase SpsE
MRRSLVAKTDLKKGTVLSANDFGFKRPANGLSPGMMEKIIGKELLVDIKKDEPFTASSVKL